MDKIYGDPVPIRDILDNKEHPDHVEVSEIMRKLQTGEINLCGCMGPVGNDPYCPCQMKAKGLTATNPWTNEKIVEFNRILDKYETE